jgi:methyl-accepting chemotaxis protein
MNRLRSLIAALANLRIGLKLVFAFAAVLLLTAAVGATALLSLHRVSDANDDLAGKWMPSIALLAQARSAALEFREFEVKHTRAADASYMAEYEDKMKAALEVMGKRLDEYRKLVRDGDERTQFAAFEKSWREYQGFVQKIVAAGRAGKPDDARDFSDGAAKVAVDESVVALDKLGELNFAGGRGSAAHADRVYGTANVAVTALFGVALLIGIVVTVALTRIVVGQLGGEPQQAAAVARAVAQGDLTTPIVVKPGDSTSLMACLRDMQASLGQVVSKVRHSAQNVAEGSAEIAQGNGDLSSRTEQQASSLQQTAASMEQLGSTVQQNADAARRADQVSRKASEVAGQGGAAVGRVVETMKGINESSKRMAEIISVIDGIAFQTNILALNAAVEAARAGEQGRGFAVVAAEVRNLAQRSAQAAREIKALIAASVDRVAQGTQQVDQAGATMDQVVAAITQVTELMAQISAASAEQSSGVQQVGEAVAQMDRTTQQNASLVEQSAAAAESLKQQARELVDAVAVFRTERVAA